MLYASPASRDLAALIQTISANRFDLGFVSPDEDPDRQIKMKIAHCDAVICALPPLSATHINEAKQLKIVHHQGVGWQDTLDWQALRDRGIPLALTTEGTATGVAEHTILLMLAASKHLAFLDRELRQGRWHNNTVRSISTELFGKRIGYVGMGRIGQAVAERLVGFGCTGLYFDLVVKLPEETERRLSLKSATFHNVLEQADIVTLHLPLTEDTRHLIGKSELHAMRQGAILINTARGGLVDENALLRVLQNGHLAAAGLDTFDTEPIGKNSPFADLHNGFCCINRW